MLSALSLRTDYSPTDLRRLAKKTKDNNQSRRLLSLAAVLDSMNHTDGARIRGRIIKIFVIWKRSYGLRRMRLMGLAKASLQIRLTAIAYNMKRAQGVVASAA